VTDITDHLASVRARIVAAATAAGRDATTITLLAVSKTQPATVIRAAYAAGQRDFGENFAQEAIEKIAALQLPGAIWHFIGHIQSNKTRDIARNFDWVHTIDRLKIAHRLNEQRPHYAGKLDVCIQMNLAEEPQKGGVDASALDSLASAVAALPRLRLRGLMTMPPANADPQTVAAIFDELRAHLGRLNDEGLDMDTLSMGMSGDLELAIAHGSTIVRVGTAIFGPRKRR